MRRARRSLSLAVAALAVAVACAAAERGRDPYAPLRRELHQEIDRLRAARGLPGLVLEEELSRWADERAARAARSGGVAAAGLSSEEAIEELARRGYEARRVTEVLLQSDGPPAEVVDFWRRQGDSGFGDALSAEYRELGIGIAVPEEAPPIYALVLARSAADDFGERTAGLADLAAVRAALVGRVNAARRSAGVPPLRADPRLDRAAQDHAERMLESGHYGHTGQDGSTPRERAARAGHPAASVAENLARGQLSPGEAVEAWLASRPHRRNLLDRDLRDVGHGVAYGRGPDGWEIYWVELFGAPREQ
jgi:uncharacterized protein YkwD